GALRISHGFDPEEFEPLEKGQGWHVLKYHIFEVSLVSVPANVDAVIELFGDDKLHCPAVKSWAQVRFEARKRHIGKGADFQSGGTAGDAKPPAGACTCG